MANLNQVIINELIEQLNSKIVDSFISKITILNKTDILLGFSHYRNEQLLISLNHNFPFVCFVNKQEDIVTETGNLNEQLKQRVKNNHVEAIDQINKDKIIQIKLGFYDDFNAKHYYFINLELIPHHPNLLIIDESYKIVFASHYSTITDPRPILRNGQYELPDHHDIKEDEYTYQDFKNFVDYYLANSLKIKDLNVYSPLLNYLDKEIKKCQRKEKVLVNELEENKDYQKYQEYGDYILTYGYDKSSLDQYIKENGLEYETTISVSDNANKYYKLYKKKKATVIHDQEEITKNRKRYEELKDDYKIIESLDQSMINDLANKYPKFIKKKAVKTNPKYPFYTIINGVKYAYGRNAMQNDYLSFRLANPSDTFLHIHNYPGAHVILMKENPTEEELAIAAQIAIYVSKKDIGEVTYAKVSTIKKGHKAGEVILSSYSTIQVKYIEEGTKQAIRNSKRFLKFVF